MEIFEIPKDHHDTKGLIWLPAANAPSSSTGRMDWSTEPHSAAPILPLTKTLHRAFPDPESLIGDACQDLLQ